jgi:hypothetical protein
MERIPLEECKHGGLYRIHSRNLSLGVFNEQSQGFIGIREKFGCYYLFTEYHWDTGPSFGTVSPVEFLEMYPGDPVESVTRPATQQDVDERISPKIEVGEEIRGENRDLFEWLGKKWDEHYREED